MIALITRADVLVGDAGTGKTTVLSAIEGAHVASGGTRFLSLAPTTRARGALAESGFDEVVLTDGRHLPAEFKAWTYGHAMTAYRSQGSTAEESLLVLGELASKSLGRRQFYVANTRYRGAHRIYIASKQQVFAQLQNPDPGRELATEFIERRRISMRGLMSVRRLPRVLEPWRQAIRAAAAKRCSVRETIHERVEV